MSFRNLSSEWRLSSCLLSKEQELVEGRHKSWRLGIFKTLFKWEVIGFFSSYQEVMSSEWGFHQETIVISWWSHAAILWLYLTSFIWFRRWWVLRARVDFILRRLNGPRKDLSGPYRSFGQVVWVYRRLLETTLWGRHHLQYPFLWNHYHCRQLMRDFNPFSNVFITYLFIIYQ